MATNNWQTPTLFLIFKLIFNLIFIDLFVAFDNSSKISPLFPLTPVTEYYFGSFPSSLIKRSSASFPNSFSSLLKMRLFSKVQTPVLCLQNLRAHSLIPNYCASTELDAGATKSNKTQSLTSNRLDSRDRYGDKQGDQRLQFWRLRVVVCGKFDDRG